MYTTEADKGPSQNILLDPKKVKIQKNIFQITMFLGNHFQTIYQILKTVANLNKIIGSTNNILQIRN